MQVLNIFHVLIAIALIVFVLIQRGQGATAGAAFGSGASGTVFGSRGAGNFLSRSTWVLAALFCTISLTMAVMVSRIMSSDEPDLGVVSETQSAQVSEETGSPEELTVGPDVSAENDVPAFELTEDLPVADESIASPAGDQIDVPAIEGEEDIPVPASEDG